VKREELKLKTGGLAPRVVVYRLVAAGRAHKLSLERAVREGDNPVLWDADRTRYLPPSRVAWECSAKWVVNSI